MLEAEIKTFSYYRLYLKNKCAGKVTINNSRGANQTQHHAATRPNTDPSPRLRRRPQQETPPPPWLQPEQVRHRLGCLSLWRAWVPAHQSLVEAV